MVFAPVEIIGEPLEYSLFGECPRPWDLLASDVILSNEAVILSYSGLYRLTS